MFNNKAIERLYLLAGTALCFFYSLSAFAETDGGGGSTGSEANIGTLASNVTGTIKNVGALVGATAYLAGFGLIIAAIFKFKAHKDNPQQTQLGQPIMLLIVGVALVFLPSLIAPAGSTIFGAGATKGGFSGTGITALS